jgi:hypothetical protein
MSIVSVLLAGDAVAIDILISSAVRSPTSMLYLRFT